MAIGKMPRRFWSYTAGKGDLRAEEREAARERTIQWVKDNWLGWVGFAIVLLPTLYILLMMLAEFRGFYILEHFRELFRPR
jgi:hypothetical protein